MWQDFRLLTKMSWFTLALDIRSVKFTVSLAVIIANLPNIRAV